jgi:hypothetical protein
LTARLLSTNNFIFKSGKSDLENNTNSEQYEKLLALFNILDPTTRRVNK